MNTKAGFSVLCLSLLVLAWIAATAFPARAVQTFAIVKCALTTACTGGNNTSSGPGVQGVSSLGKGVIGQAKFNSTSSGNGQSGVLGQDMSTSGSFDTGVKGTSARGIGVVGTSSTNSGVQGTSTSGFGVRAISSGNTAVFGSTTNGIFAIEGSAPSTVGVLGVGSTGLQGQDNNTGGDAIFANGTGGNIIRANNSSGVDVLTVFDSGVTQMQTAQAGGFSVGVGVNAFGTHAAIQAEGLSSAPYGILVNGSGAAGSAALAASNTAGLIIDAFGANGEVFNVDIAGNVHAHSFNSDLATATRTSNGSMISTYSSEARVPSIEDFGEAILISGHAYVRLDRDFASAMARGTPYLVFITPQTPVRSPLYVTRKTALGFDVGQAYPERTAVTFDYRIVARRYAGQAQQPRGIPPTLRRRPIVTATPPTLRKHPLREKLSPRP